MTRDVDWRYQVKEIYFSEREVSVRAFGEVMGWLPTGLVDEGTNPERAVTGVSYAEATEFCEKLTRDDPDNWQYTLPGTTDWTYAAFGHDLLGGTMSLESAFQRIGWGASGDEPNGIGLSGLHGQVWEWTRRRFRKPALRHGAVSFEDTSETPAEPLRMIVGGGRRDLFVHAYDMNYGVNDFLVEHQNSVVHVEGDGATRYLHPGELGTDMVLRYRYDLDSPIVRAVIRPMIHLNAEGSGSEVRVRVESRAGDRGGGQEAGEWQTVETRSGIDESDPRDVDISSWVRGAVSISVEFRLRATELPLHYTQFCRTAGELMRFPEAGRFVAECEPPNSGLRPMRALPESFRSRWVGFRVVMLPKDAAAD